MIRKYLRKATAAAAGCCALVSTVSAGHPVFAAESDPEGSVNPFGILSIIADCTFTDTDRTAYFKKDSAIYLQPYGEAEKAGDADQYAKVHVTGTNGRGFWRISDGKRSYYVRSADLTTDSSYVTDAIKKEQEEQAKAAAAAKKAIEDKKNSIENSEKKMKEKAWAAFQERLKKLDRIDSVNTDSGASKDKETMTSFSTSEAFRNAPTNAAKIWVYLTEHGFNDIEAAAILGNIQAESSFNPRATDGGLGLIQWISGRAANLRRYTGSSLWTIEGQLSFMIHELKTYESGALARLRAARTPAEAAYVWDRYYERSAGWSTRTRMKNAVKWYNTFHKGTTAKDMLAVPSATASASDAKKSSDLYSTKSSSASQKSGTEKSKTADDAKTSSAQTAKPAKTDSSDTAGNVNFSRLKSRLERVSDGRND